MSVPVLALVEFTGRPVPSAHAPLVALGAVGRLPSPTGEEHERPFFYADNSIGGCVGQQLLLDAPGRVRAAVLLGTAARVGEPAAGAERARLVAAAGTPTQVAGSAQRWFAPGFLGHSDSAPIPSEGARA